MAIKECDLNRLTFDFPEGNQWLKESVGISRELLDSLDKDDDWTFVIKMHGILEAGLNHLLLTEFNNSNLRKVVARLDTGNEETGKIAFIRTCKLLPESACKFIRLFGEIRNNAVHDVRNFDFNLKAFFQNRDANQLKTWKTALTCWHRVADEVGGDKSPTAPDLDEGVRTLAVQFPRTAIYNCCMSIMLRSLAHQRKLERQQALLGAAETLYEKGLQVIKERGMTLEDAMEEYLEQTGESRPKEQ